MAYPGFGDPAVQYRDLYDAERAAVKCLLSFAQFEREVTSERIRDKIAAINAGASGSGQRAAWVRAEMRRKHLFADQRVIFWINVRYRSRCTTSIIL
jgi:hypothetical protein